MRSVWTKVQKSIGVGVVGTIVSFGAPQTGAEEVRNWSEITAAAAGQTVYWNAWGGKQEINDFMAWVGAQADERYGVKMVHVKLDSTSAAVSRILAEKAAGNTGNGSVDFLWANGENFATLKNQDLLFGPWTQVLPNYQLVALDKPTNTIDFGEPVEHMEVPYGMAQLNFAYHPSRMPEPPKTPQDFLSWAQDNPGRITYPTPENWIGNTFLKQILVALSENPGALSQPVDSVDFAAETEVLWQYLDALHPAMWRQGTDFPADEVQQRTMLADGEVDLNISFGPAETSVAIEQGLLPPQIRTFVFESGTIANSHFLSIPFNAQAKEGAMVLANIILSPEAQARKQSTDGWGDTTVLDLGKLTAEQRSFFDALPKGVATLDPQELGTPLSEPHFTWGPALTQTWLTRYRGS